MKIAYDKIHKMRGNLVTVIASGVGLGELARIELRDGRNVYGTVLRIDENQVTIQAFQNTRGMSTGDRIVFLNREMQATYGNSLLGRRLNGAGLPIDGGPKVVGEAIDINTSSLNPVKRAAPREMVQTNIPMIDIFNTLVRSQKIPIFSIAGEPYNKLLMRIANQTNADIVILGGMGLTFKEYQAFIDNSETSGTINKTIMFIHQAIDPAVECLLVPDMALACAERFAMDDKHVLVLLTDMTAYGDALKEIAITMDQIPSNRGYPGSLYSELAARYEKAGAILNKGSITIMGVTLMPGDDITHPIPDNTGYITEGQLILKNKRISLFESLSRLKQLVIGKVTREDHADLANTMTRLYADFIKTYDKKAMGFELDDWDKQLLCYGELFEKKMMNWHVNCFWEQALDLGWQILAECFHHSEVGIKNSLIQKYWPLSIKD